MASNRSRNRADQWWEQPVTLPAAENVPVRKRRRRARLITAYIWAAVVLFPLALLTTFVLAGQQLGRGADDQPDTRTYAGQEAAQAQIEVEKWIAQKPSPLPGGRVVTYNGARTTAAEADGGEPAGDTVATHEFVVADRARNLYTTTVQMVVSPARGPVMVADPALLPIPAPDAGGADAPWPFPGVEAGAPSPAYQPAVDAWAKAYTSGDPAVLKQVVGDPQQGRSYLPLTGVEFDRADLDEVGALWGEDQDRSAETLPARALLRVTVHAAWAGQPAATAGQPAATLTYDLLLDRADTAAPVVVAWGSPGMALDPYGNAVEGRTLAAADPGSSPGASPPGRPAPTPTKR